jgi:hypothetical protein
VLQAREDEFAAGLPARDRRVVDIEGRREPQTIYLGFEQVVDLVRDRALELASTQNALRPLCSSKDERVGY